MARVPMPPWVMDLLAWRRKRMQQGVHPRVHEMMRDKHGSRKERVLVTIPFFSHFSRPIIAHGASENAGFLSSGQKVTHTIASSCWLSHSHAGHKRWMDGESDVKFLTHFPMRLWAMDFSGLLVLSLALGCSVADGFLRVAVGSTCSCARYGQVPQSASVWRGNREVAETPEWHDTIAPPSNRSHLPASVEPSPV